MTGALANSIRSIASECKDRESSSGASSLELNWQAMAAIEDRQRFCADVFAQEKVFQSAQAERW